MAIIINIVDYLIFEMKRFIIISLFEIFFVKSFIYFLSYVPYKHLRMHKYYHYFHTRDLT